MHERRALLSERMREVRAELKPVGVHPHGT
jgi:hypothetical protein